MSSERVARFKERQKASGRKPFNPWLSADAIRELRERARATKATSGQVIEQLLAATRSK